MTPDPVYWSSLRKPGVAIEGDPVPYIVAGRIANEARQGEAAHRLQNRALATENAERVGQFFDLVAEGRPTPGYDTAERQRLIELAEGAVPPILLALQSSDDDGTGASREGRDDAPNRALTQRPEPAPTEDEPRTRGALRAMTGSVPLSPAQEPAAQEEAPLPPIWCDGEVASEAHRAIDSMAGRPPERSAPRRSTRVVDASAPYWQPRPPRPPTRAPARARDWEYDETTSFAFIERRGSLLLACGVLAVLLSLFLSPSFYGYLLVGAGGATSVVGMWGVYRAKGVPGGLMRTSGA